MCVAATAKRRRKQLKLTKVSKNRTQSAAKKYEEAKYSTAGSGKKK